MDTKAHGALVEVLEVGVLLMGPSGIGKSECALELISRGHPLVADDVVEIERGTDGRLWGRAPELIRHHMEIRGIGIFSVPELYGANSVRSEVTIDLLCRLEHWREGADYERIGLDRAHEELAGVKVPALVLPARPAGSMATLVELAAREHVQRTTEGSAAARLDERIRGEARRA